MAVTIYPNAGVQMLVGNWTHTDGAVMETLAISGTVWGATFSSNATSGSSEVEVEYSTAISGAITTITIYNNATVTNGQFVIWYTPE